MSRVIFSRGGWCMWEVTPRVRVYYSETGLSLGFGWLVFWLHIWVWLRPQAPPAPPVPVGDRWYVCNSTGCYWAGRLQEAVHPKHDAETVLCPDCYETTTWFEPHAVVRMEDGSCHECGQSAGHAMHVTKAGES